MSQAMLWIAIVDDDPSVLKALARLLRAHALHVRTYTSAREFLRRSLTSAGGRRDCRSGANRLERGSLLVSRPRIAFRYRQFRVRSQASRQDRGLREGSFGLRAQPNLLNAIKLMLSVQSHPKKYSGFRHPQISATNTASHPSRGALAIVTNVGVRCGGRGSVGRERDRGAKSFGLRERSAGAQDERRCSPASQKLRRRCTIRRSTWRGRVAYGKTVWSWHPLLVSSRRRFSQARPGLAKPLIRR
jgi:hypothetical protein